MRLKLYFLPLFLLFVLSSSATTLEGNISSDMMLNGHIDVNANVYVESNVTLTIGEGAVVSLSPGVSIKGLSRSRIRLMGSADKPIRILGATSKNWGSIEVSGAGAVLEIHHIEASAGRFRVLGGSTGILQDSYFHDFFELDHPIIYALDPASFTMQRCSISNYYEVNLVRSAALVEDCVFQYMTGDGIDFDNSLAGATLRHCTLRYGIGFNIDAVDFGKVNFSGYGSIGLVEQCLIHDISDKGVSIGEGAQDITVRGCVIYNCGAGVAVKDYSFGHIVNCTLFHNDVGIECVEKNPGLGGGIGYAINDILWENNPETYLNSNAHLELNYCDVEGMPDPLNNNFSQDPLFTNPEDYDFHLQAGSPALGAGINGEDLGAIFPVGGPDSLYPQLKLGLPNPFSILTAGENTGIYWSASEQVQTVRISFSPDNGQNWQVINVETDAESGAMNWIAPAIYSSQCKMRVEALNVPELISENIYPFSILPPVDSSQVPLFSKPAGYYSQPVDLSLTSDIPGAIVYYTLDGTDPDDRSFISSGPLHLTNDSVPTGQPELDITASQSYHAPYSYIRTSPVHQIGQTVNFWTPPTLPVQKAQVVKARLYIPGQGLGPVKTHSYFIHPEMLSNRYTLPVVSIVTDPSNLFDYYNGIYIPGATYRDSSFTGNYELKGRASERPAHIELFEPDGSKKISQDVGIRIRGEFIRGVGQKAMTVYARSEYDTENKFKYAFFPGIKKPGTNQSMDSFKRFILRNNGNDWGTPMNTMCKDALIQSLFNNLHFEYSPYRMSVLFINGEYWGLHDLRQNYDARGIQYAFDVEPDSVVLMEDNLEGYFRVIQGNDGDQQDFLNLRDFILNNDLNINGNYDSVCRRMDVDNFCDYWLGTIYSNKRNTDHNKTYWKLRTPTSTPLRYGHDARWRWIANDFDNGFMFPEFDNLDYMVSEMQDSLLKGLLRSDVFREHFIVRYCDLLNSSFKAPYVHAKINQMQDLLAPEMPEHIGRWGTPASMDEWEGNMDTLRYFADGRTAYQFTHMRTMFGLEDTSHLSLDVSNPSQGFIKLNTLNVNEALSGVGEEVYPWSGTYFENLPLTITATPYYGYKFIRWKESGSTNPVEKITLNGDSTFTAEFEWDPSITHPDFTVFPNPAIGDNLRFSQQAKVAVYDLTGKLVLEKMDTKTLDISNLERGVYILRTSEGVEVKLVRM